MNLWSLLFAIAAAQGVFLSIVLFAKPENRLPNRLLGCLLLLLAIILAEWVLWWTQLIREVPGLMAISLGFPLLYGPLLYLFFAATFEHKPLKVNLLWHFLPFLAVVCFMLPFYLRFYENVAAALQWIPPLTRRPWFPVLVFAQMIVYGLWMDRRFKKYFLEKDELRRWGRLLLLAYWGIVLTCVFYRLMPYFGLMATAWQYLVAFGMMTFIYLVAWLGYIEPQVLAGVPLQEAINPIKYRKSVLTAENSAALYRRIADLMEEEKLYRDSQLSLASLAEKLPAQRHHVSQAINEQAGKTFSEFVNEHRIRAAQRLLAETKKQELNAIEVAYQVGFGSKNAFNLAFKKYTGVTPSAYRQGEGEKA